MTTRWVVTFDEIRRADVALVGGKGANLGELTQAGLPVPPGFCVTTDAFRQAMDAPNQVLPEPVESAIVEAWNTLGTEDAYAVRSSATAEDSPHASFAGQHDTFLDVQGRDALLEAIHACFASLHTERAVAYRRQKGIDETDVAIAVVVQRMVASDKAGILFTAHPLTGHRHMATIDAGFGLGEALVSGTVSADFYEIDRRSGEVTEARIGGGRPTRVLEDEEARHIVRLGDRIEAHFGTPQDVEWCIEAGEVFIVQARPITSLYPLLSPEQDDGTLHVSFCINHFQVMTDAMPPLALQLWRIMLPFGKSADDTESPWMHVAAGRMFLDISKALRVPIMRRVFHSVLGHVDVLAQAAVHEIAERPAFRDGPRARKAPVARLMAPKVVQALGWIFFRNTESAASDYTSWIDDEVARVEEQLAEGTLPDRLRRAVDVFGKLIFIAFELPPLVLGGIFAGKLLQRLTGRDEVALAPLGRGLRGNVTTEMDLAVGDLADLARQDPAVSAALAKGDFAVEEGSEFALALAAFLDTYGARAPAEIDISRPRWRDEPQSILAAVAGALDGEAGSHRTHHARMVAEGEALARELIADASLLERGLVRRLCRAHRELLPLREHPKFLLVRSMDLLRNVVLEAGDELVRRGLLAARDDAFFLLIEELAAALEEGTDQSERVALRKAEHAHAQTLFPPRVVTSDGESPIVRHTVENLPSGAIAGSAASAGVVEGVARVITDPSTQRLERGEILVATFTDPGWTPLFINAAGLVMEVGGMLTHGSVVAREYGIPAVVCVPDATRLIRDGARIRVDGDRGFVELLEA